jgi:hypothetical protein
MPTPGPRRSRKLARPLEEALRNRLRNGGGEAPPDLFPLELDAALDAAVEQLMADRPDAKKH